MTLTNGQLNAEILERQGDEMDALSSLREVLGVQGLVAVVPDGYSETKKKSILHYDCVLISFGVVVVVVVVNVFQMWSVHSHPVTVSLARINGKLRKMP